MKKKFRLVYYTYGLPYWSGDITCLCRHQYPCISRPLIAGTGFLLFIYAFYLYLWFAADDSWSPLRKHSLSKVTGLLLFK